MKKTILAIASIAGLSLSGVAFAQDFDFATLDADASGGVSFEELQVLFPDISEDEFASYDGDANGELSEDEFEAMAAADASGGSMAVEGDAGAEAPVAP